MNVWGMRKVLCFFSLVVLAVPAGGTSGGDEETRLAHRVGRVALNLPENGSFGICLYGEERLGLRWPGSGGSEFLGDGGIFVRFRTDLDKDYRSVSPAAFKTLNKGLGRRDLYEGCEGGKRYPHRDRDDDSDGLVDEDPFDGLDNDADGLVDEDFAAIGNEMMVNRTIDPATGLLLIQNSYAWAYGHVRDFVGFTTYLSYPKELAGRAVDLVDLDALIYMDFQKGDADDARRGMDDIFFFLSQAGTGKRQEEGGFPLEIPVVSDANSQTAFASLLVLDAVGPDGSSIGWQGVICAARSEPDSLWTFVTREGESGRAIIRTSRNPEVQDEASPSSISEENLSMRDRVEGDFAIAHRVGPVSRLKPGEKLRIEWALVVGKSVEVLFKNAVRALETYDGIKDNLARSHHWVPPARKAARRELEVKPASVWANGSWQPAAAIVIPPDLSGEEVEWLRAEGFRTILHEQVDSKILVTLGQSPLQEGETVRIEGQLTDGTIFTANLDAVLLNAHESDSLPPGSLPEESLQLYPNPFLTTLNISISVFSPFTLSDMTAPGDIGGVSFVRIYDVKGRLVRTVFEEEFLHPGEYAHTWDGLDEYGKEVAPGVYYVRLQVGSRTITKRVILLR